MKKQNITFIGLRFPIVNYRDIDSEERKILKDNNITYYDMFDVEEQGITSIMEKILKNYKNSPIHLSFDIDGVDPDFAPGTGTRVRGGLNYRESHYIVKKLSSSE